MAGGQFAAEDTHASEYLSLRLVRPDVFLDVDLIDVLEIADVEIDRVCQVGSTDVNMAPGVRVSGPIRHRHVFCVSWKCRVVAEEAAPGQFLSSKFQKFPTVSPQIHGNDHEWLVRKLLKVSFPGPFKVGPECLDFSIRGTEFARGVHRVPTQELVFVLDHLLDIEAAVGKRVDRLSR